MVKAAGVAVHRHLDLAQRGRARKLGEQQRHQMRLGGQLAHPSIRLVLFHKFLELPPGQMLQKLVQDAIVMTHGIVSFSCPNHRQVFESE